MRIRAMDEETGEFDDTLQTISGDIYELTHGQVSIMQDANTYKDIYTILDDISKVWDSLTDKEHATLTETLFGKHRANIGSAIISNFEQARKAIETMENADGGAMAEMEVIMDSISYRANIFKETLVGIAQSSFSQEFLKSMVDSGTRVLNVFDDLSPSISFILEQFANLLELVTKLADTIGGIPTLMLGIGLKNIGNIKTWLYELKEVQKAVNGISTLSAWANGGTNQFADSSVVIQYANQLRGLSAQQVELALSTKMLTAEQKQQIMVELGLIASEDKIQSELLQTALAQAGLSAEKQKAVLNGLNLINVTTGEVIANEACTKSALEERLALENVTIAQAENVMSTLGMSTANTTATVSFEVLTKSIKKSIVALGSFLFTTPAGWATIAVASIVGVVAAISSYNKEQEELRQQVEESAKTLKEQTSAMEDLVSQYEAILDSEKTEAEKTEELNEWKQTLADTYGFEKDKLRELNLEREEGIELLKQEIDASSQYQRDKWEKDNKDQIDTAVDEIYYPEEYQQSLKEYYSRFYNDVSDSIKQVMSKNNTPVTNAFEDLEQQKELYSELVKLKEQADLSELDNIIFTEADQQLLDEVSDEIDILEKDIEKYGDIYKQHFDNKAISFLDYYKENNNAEDFEEFTEEGKQAYVSWRNGLLEEAGKTEYGSEVQNGLKDILQADYSEYEKYFENLATAKEKFLSNIKINSQADIEAKKSYEAFIDGLNSDELNILLGLDDTVFNQGIDGVKKIIADIQTDPNYVIEVDIAIDEEKLENLHNSIKEITDSQKDLNSALEEQKEHGQLSASTIQSLTEAGYAEALVIDKVTGAVTLNTTAYEKLINEKKKEIQLEIARLKVDLINPYKDETAAIADLERSLSTLNATEREATQIKIANMKAQLANSKLTDEQIRQKEQQLADLEAMLASLDAPTFDDSSSSSSGSDDDTPESVKNFETELAKRQHEINLGLRKEDASYYDWLEQAAHKAYDGLADYEDDLWKYEEQVYEWRKDHEQDLFDQKIENLDKEKEKALENNDFDTAKTSVNTQITETKKRIVELKTSGKQDVDDEIKQLEEDLDNFNDDLKDISSQEYEFKVSVVTDNVDEQIEALDRSIENTGDTKLYSKKIKVYKDGQQQILDMIKFYRKQGYAEDSAIIKELKKQWNDYQDSISDALQEQANAQVEAYNELLDEQKELLEQQKEAQDEYYDSEIKALEDKKAALEKVNETIEEQNELEEKRQAIAEAERNLYKNVRLVYSGGQWVQKAREEDLQAVKDAENDLSDTLRQQEIEALENQITALEDAKSEFDESIDKQITAIEESEKAFEKAMENSYKVRQQLDYEFISAIVGDDKAKEYQTNADNALKAIAEAEKTDSGNTDSNTESTADSADNSALIDSNNAVAETNREVAESNLQKLSADDALKSIYNSFQKSGALFKGTTFEKFAGNIQSGALNATLNTAPKIADDIVKGSMVNNYTVNNSPIINTTVNVDGRNKSDDEIANIVATTAESKVTQALTAFVQGANNRFTKMMYGNT